MAVLNNDLKSKLYFLMRVICSIIGVTSFTNAYSLLAEDRGVPHLIMERYPDDIQASVEQNRRELGAAGQNVSSAAFHLIVPAINRWTPGTTVRVAFNGGDKEVRAKIEDAAKEWTKPGRANLAFEFKDQNDEYHEWNPFDTAYSAEIRITFASGRDGGYWSLVGKDSINGNINGGQPNRASMNLDNFDKELPGDWRATVIHEFGHALGFQHEHQNPLGGCDFRFEDDPGYKPTQDSAGWYAEDDNHKRPGLYTYLGGYKNYWPKTTVDSNLKNIPVSSAFLAGPFDRKSIMKYFFSGFMFVQGSLSPCYTKTENLTLSVEDIKGARQAYPVDTKTIEIIAALKKSVLTELIESKTASISVVQNSRSILDGMK